MFINTDRFNRRPFLFFASAPLVGLALIVVAFVVNGPLVLLMSADFWRGVILTLFPLVIVGIAAGVASNRSAMIGWCTWIGGFAAVLAIFNIGFLAYQQDNLSHAWTGATLTYAGTVCAALPASVVGSLIGLGIGFAISHSQNTRTVDEQADRDDMAEEPRAAP